ncbi:hypothetical protein NQ315_011446 [Exocentrus adspersus]|uniref:Cyclic nucleotide-binding domain-containing protein n=1 Tax=Exocentrus adspersus TaxID=1586481 RepID=A0AAV8VUM7_9CUCU|nr:hypothetical protein NQ315_011446 [Exocentrus adspersus]
MHHKCTIGTSSRLLNNLHWTQKIRLVSIDNPLRYSYFRSHIAVAEEQIRQLKTSKYVIHPFSKFRAWYQLFLIFLYGSTLVTKALDTGFTLRERSFYYYYTLSTDVMCWMDIVINFFTGYEIEGTKDIELRMWSIAKHYALGPYFLLDAISSLPKAIFYIVENDRSKRLGLLGTISLAGMFKLARLVSLIRCIKNSTEYFSVAGKGVLFLISSTVMTMTTVHWMACMQFAVPRIKHYFLKSTFDVRKKLWYHQGDLNLYSRPFTEQYIHCFFKSTAYLLNIYLSVYPVNLPEEYVLAVVTYCLGKILIAFVWIILAVAILNSRYMNVKYAELTNQLEEYMAQKQLPVRLRNRIQQYFLFKYRNRYFKEDLIVSLLSNNLKSEVSLHICGSLIRNVALFSHMTTTEVNKMVDYLIPEIFLPNDTITQSGSHADAMYFLNSGTVAVYTRSGREIDHLQDGAYFGEIAILLKNETRISTVVAIEISHVYRLNKRDLRKYLLTNKKIMEKLMRSAEKKYHEIVRLEEEYKTLLLERSLLRVQNLGKASPSPSTAVQSGKRKA